jgi:hypothetical protein
MSNEPTVLPHMLYPYGDTSLPPVKIEIELAREGVLIRIRDKNGDGIEAAGVWVEFDASALNSPPHIRALLYTYYSNVHGEGEPQIVPLILHEKIGGDIFGDWEAEGETP